MEQDIRWKQRFANFTRAFNGEVWMDMIKTRNLTSHTYDIELAELVFIAITERFYPALVEFSNRFTHLLDEKPQ